MSDDAYATILRDVLDEADRGAEPRLDALRARHPGHENTVERVFEAFSSYREFRSALSRAAAPLVDALPPGERLGDFEIVERIGSGGMGVVYRARQLSLGGRIVALKVVALEEGGSQALPRFAREALAVADLHHAHLAEIHGFGEAGGMLFFAMRFVEGRTLGSVLELLAEQRRNNGHVARAASTRRDIVGRIAEIADALATVHAAGLVHRDVKPENIVLEGPGTADGDLLHGDAVLIDFGLVRRADINGVAHGNTNVATPSYASPEQMLGHDVDARSDVFSLGVTLHDLLAGRMPRDRMQASAGLEPIDALLPDIDRDLAAVVSKAVDPTPRWRYANAAEFGADLAAWLAGRPVSARRLRATERARNWVIAHPAQVLRASSLAVLGVLIAVLMGAWGRYSEFARAARVARERGDVRTVFAALERIPPSLEWLVLRDRELVALAQRARGGDWILDIKRKLDANDFSGALYSSATHMRLNGLDSDELVSRFFIAALHSAALAAPMPERDARHTWRFTPLVARLMYERPDVTAADVLASANLHAAIVETFHSVGFERFDRLYLMTALSGCGRPKDVDWILEWGLMHQPNSEERRLALTTVERIVRRAHSCVALDRIDRARLWQRIEPAVNALRESRSEVVSSSWSVAVHRLVIALALARSEPSTDDPVLNDFRNSIDVDDPRVLADWWIDLAAMRDPRIRELLMTNSSPAFEIADCESWGRACALYFDQKLTDEVSRKCATRGTAAAIAFANGRRAGEGELHGENNELLPDANTCLGADNPPENFLAPECVVADDLPADVDARWKIEATYVQLWGSRTHFESELARHTLDGPFAGYMLLSVFGKSAVRLGFDLAEVDKWRNRELRIEIQNGARVYYPFEGVVLLDVMLNDTLLAEQLLAHSTSLTRYIVDLPVTRLVPGRNVIDVRLNENTTTTARFGGAEISRKQK